MNIIHILDPTKMPTARTINKGTIICPSSMIILHIIKSLIFSHVIDAGLLRIIDGLEYESRRPNGGIDNTDN